MTLTNQHEGVKELTVLISSSAITVDGFALGSSVPALGFGTDAAINGVFERVVRGGRSQIFQNCWCHESKSPQPPQKKAGIYTLLFIKLSAE